MTCYVIVKDFNREGSVAVELESPLYIRSIDDFVEKNNKKLEVVLLSKPSAFMEYAPYEFVDNIEQLKKRVVERF